MASSLFLRMEHSFGRPSWRVVSSGPSPQWTYERSVWYEPWPRGDSSILRSGLGSLNSGQRTLVGSWGGSASEKGV